MPTYEYACPAGHEFEKFQKITEKPRARCPVCGKPATRKISGGVGLVFKGSGFYITDYRSENYKQAAKKESGGGESKAGETKAAESKPAAGDKKSPSTPASGGGGTTGKKK